MKPLGGRGRLALAQQQHQVGGFGAAAGPADRLGVNAFGRLPQAGGVGYPDRHAPDYRKLADPVARGARPVVHDADLAPDQGVGEGALAGVGRTRQDDLRRVEQSVHYRQSSSGPAQLRRLRRLL